jgi:hypothetical protein
MESLLWILVKAQKTAWMLRLESKREDEMIKGWVRSAESSLLLTIHIPERNTK